MRKPPPVGSTWFQHKSWCSPWPNPGRSNPARPRPETPESWVCSLAEHTWSSWILTKISKNQQLQDTSRIHLHLQGTSTVEKKNTRKHSEASIFFVQVNAANYRTNCCITEVVTSWGERVKIWYRYHTVFPLRTCSGHRGSWSEASMAIQIITHNR